MHIQTTTYSHDKPIFYINLTIARFLLKEEEEQKMNEEYPAGKRTMVVN